MCVCIHTYTMSKFDLVFAHVLNTNSGITMITASAQRLFDVRYFCSHPAKYKFTQQWNEAISTITKFVGIDTFDIAVTSWVFSSHRNILQELVKAERWVTVDHHICHATLGFYDSPFCHALVLSYDGGGNDGMFNVYHASRDSGVIKHIQRVDLNLGAPYRDLANTMPEVTGQHWNPDKVSAYVRFAPLALAGKVMGYAALGSVREDWIPALKDYYQHYFMPLASMFTLGEELGLRLEQNGIANPSDARDLAATSQHVFNLLLNEQVTRFLAEFKKDHQHPGIDGIVLTGGCALNVHGNQMVAQTFGYPIHVAPAPNDAGISVGAAWSVIRPKVTQQIQYAGLPLFDANYLSGTAIKRHAKEVTIPELADLLVNGAIIGIVRGRQEFGPRALGHRSLVCYPNKDKLKEIINKLKSREWFRPLCPTVSVECAAKIFEGIKHKSDVQYDAESKNESAGDESIEPLTRRLQDVRLHVPDSQEDSEWLQLSPYMSFAPYLTLHAQKLFPAVTHYNGTARLQTVSADDEPWFHSLLVEVGKHTGYEILLNTSLNVKGKPIVNRLSTALKILDSSPPDTVDFLLVEDWLFSAVRTVDKSLPR